MDSQNTASTKLDVYQMVTDRIIALLEAGTVPWQRPWAESGLPMNVISKRAYRGINLWLLLSLNYECNLFLTWDQLKKIGGSVNQGQHGHIVVFWKQVKKVPEELDDKGKPKQIPMLRYYKVFNVSQCRDVPKELVPELVKAAVDPILECEAILNNVPDMPLITFSGKAAAYYNLEKDEIALPKMKSFKTSPAYYATVFHELIHATGAEKRLNRKTVTERVSFGTPSYALEELIAEMGSAFLCRFSGILPAEISNTVAYLDNWLGVLKGDKRFIVSAAGLAQRAVDYLLNRQDNESKEEVGEAIDESMVS
jgi:antirestriction protein ArdC